MLEFLSRIEPFGRQVIIWLIAIGFILETLHQLGFAQWK